LVGPAGERVGRSGLNLALQIRFELSVDAGDSFIEDCDRFYPGFECFGGVACVEVAGMRLFRGVSALRLFEFLLEVG
jgi:hypothetical protein